MRRETRGGKLATYNVEFVFSLIVLDVLLQFFKPWCESRPIVW